MRRVVAKRHAIDVKASKMRGAERADFDVMVGESTIVEEAGRPLIVYEVLPDGVATDLESAIIQIKRFDRGARTRGLPTTSRIFGFSPRREVRQNASCCKAAIFCQDEPDAYRAICEFAVTEMDPRYRSRSPEVYAHHAEAVAKVLPDWKIPGTLYTSGIVNWNNALRYHHDAGNFKGCWSGMVVLPNRVEGGELVVPELRMAFEFKRPAVIFFDGQSLLHGVMPISTPKMGYRYSIVYYSLQKMCLCKSPAEELESGRAFRTRAEQRRMAYARGEAVPDERYAKNLGLKWGEKK